MRGELFVFEGPDGIGKSTLSSDFTSRLRTIGLPVEHLSLPGRESGSLGRLVDELHHDPRGCSVQVLTPTSLQAIHLAAHVDAIERRILPALASGAHVVLDRYWWSTWVYGLTSGIPLPTLKALLRVEKLQWGRTRPSLVYLVSGEESRLHGKTDTAWKFQSATYADLALEEARHHPVVVIRHHNSIEEAGESVTMAVALLNESKVGRICSQGMKKSVDPGYIPVGTEREHSPPPRGNTPQTSTVYDTYWRFAAERQAIFFRRLSGEPGPWTSDEILKRHKFTNAYRASDRVSQFLISEVIYQRESDKNAREQVSESPSEIFFRTFLFKIFNRISTWQILEAALGAVMWEEYDFRRYDEILNHLRTEGTCIFSSAYIMPSGSSSFGYAEKHRNYLKLLERMIEDEVPQRLTDLKTMKEAFDLLRSYPTIGNFLAYQFVIDLNYGPLTDFSEAEFVMPGPGARDGIAKCFSDTAGWAESDIIRWMMERQQLEFDRLGIEFKELWGRPLQLIDCQNLFCEVDKYSRVAHPDVQGLSGRTRIKQLFQPATANFRPWYPPKWGLNTQVNETLCATGRDFAGWA